MEEINHSHAGENTGTREVKIATATATATATLPQVHSHSHTAHPPAFFGLWTLVAQCVYQVLGGDMSRFSFSSRQSDVITVTRKCLLEPGKFDVSKMSEWRLADVIMMSV